jgi:hypothetical protein
MSRNIQETKSLMAVSRIAQADLHTAATIDCRFLVDSGSLFKTDHDRETDAEDISGYEGASQIIPFGHLASAELSQKRAKPDFILWALAFALGLDVPVPAGSTGFKHTITPAAGSDMPAFTAVQLLGETLLRERYVGNIISEFTLGLTDKWITAKAGIKGCGMKDVDWIAETVAALETVTTLTLEKNIQGATEAERLNSIHLVRVKLHDQTKWTEVPVTGSAAAKTIQFVAPGAESESVNFQVLYVPEVETYFEDLPEIKEESYLRVTDLTIRIGAEWSGAVLAGGRLITGDFLSGELKIVNEGEMRYVPGSGIDYGGGFERSVRNVSLSLTTKMRDILMEYWREANEYFGVSIKLTGAEFEDGHNFDVEIILPKCAINEHKIAINNKIFASEGDLIALEGTYDKIIVIGENQVEEYLIHET